MTDPQIAGFCRCETIHDLHMRSDGIEYCAECDLPIDWGPVIEENKMDLSVKLVLLIADMLTLPPDNDRIRQIFNVANELRRSVPSGSHEDYVRASNAVRAIAMRNAEK